MNRSIYTLIFFTLLAVSCKKDDPTPELVVNGNIENGQEGWVFGVEAPSDQNPNNYAGGWFDEAAYSGRNSLKINCNEVKNPESFCWIGQQIITPNIPKGAKVTLKAKIKTVNLVGEGVSMLLRGDRIGESIALLHQGTEGNISITGTNDFKDYEVVIDSYAGGVNALTIFLVYLPKTTGAVYFDDIQLVVN